LYLLADVGPGVIKETEVKNIKNKTKLNTLTAWIKKVPVSLTAEDLVEAEAVINNVVRQDQEIS
jgi:ribosomal protein S20